MLSAIARRYARALFEVAQAAHAADAVERDLARLSAALADPDARAAMLAPGVGRQELAARLEAHLPGADALTRGALRVALARRREAMLPELHAAFAGLLREAQGLVEGVVESAKPLPREVVRELEERMAATVGKRVALATRVVPALIGGVRVRVGNTLYDGSVQAALDELERRLMAAPLP